MPSRVGVRTKACVVGVMLTVACGLLVGPGARAATAQTTRSVYVSIVDDDGQRVDGVTPGDLTLKEGGVEYEVTSVTYPTERLHLTILVEEFLAPDDNLRFGIFEMAKRLIPQADIGLVLINNRAETLVEHTSNINTLVRGLNSVPVGRMRRIGNLVDAVFEVTRRIETAGPLRPAMVVVALDTSQASDERPDRVFDQLRKSRAVFHAVTVVGGFDVRSAGQVGVPFGTALMLTEMAARSQILGDGPRQSGGHRIELRSTYYVGGALEQVADELSAQYLVTYVLPEGVEPSGRLEVSLNGTGAELRAPTRIAD